MSTLNYSAARPSPPLSPVPSRELGVTNMNYAVGNNDPGYLPDSEPYVTSDADQAKQVLIADMLFNADHCDDEAEAEELTAWAEDLNLSDVAGGWSVEIAGRAYWIEPTDEEADDEGEN